MFQASRFKFKMKKGGASSSDDGASKAKPFVKEKLVLDDKKFREIRDYIYDKSGMYFNDSKKYLLENRLVKRVESLSLNGFDEYFYYIRYDQKKEKELIELFNAITINETSFFRNEPQIEAYSNEVLPEIIRNAKAEGRKEITIWSAASSSGEEPYTLAIMVHEIQRMWKGALTVKIVGSDISTDIIDQAKEGAYNEYSVRNIPPEFMKKYFENAGQKYVLSDLIKNYVEFVHINLIDMNEMSKMKGADIIFCRNVLIYFDTASKTKVVSKLYDNLNRGGYLFIGHSESLHGISKAFRLVHFNKSIAYKKE